MAHSQVGDKPAKVAKARVLAAVKDQRFGEEMSGGQKMVSSSVPGVTELLEGQVMLSVKQTKKAKKAPRVPQQYLDANGLPLGSYIDLRNAELYSTLEGRYEQLPARTRYDLDALVKVIGFDDYLDFLGVLKEFLYYIYDVAPFHPVKNLKEMITQTLQQVLQQRLSGEDMVVDGVFAGDVVEMLNALPGDVLQKMVDGESPDILWDLLMGPGKRPVWESEAEATPISAVFTSEVSGFAGETPSGSVITTEQRQAI